jgi:hypothetical protein
VFCVHLYLRVSSSPSIPPLRIAKLLYSQTWIGLCLQVIINYYLSSMPQFIRIAHATSTHRRMYPSTHRDHTARFSFEWEEVKMEDVQVATAAYYINACDWAARDV